MSTIYYTVTISLPYLLEAIDVVDGVGDTAVLRLGGVEEVHLQHSTAQPLHSACAACSRYTAERERRRRNHEYQSLASDGSQNF